jgi:hypothetical protein
MLELSFPRVILQETRPSLPRNLLMHPGQLGHMRLELGLSHGCKVHEWLMLFGFVVCTLLLQDVTRAGLR